jgi:hypothetical protein
LEFVGVLEPERLSSYYCFKLILTRHRVKSQLLSSYSLCLQMYQSQKVDYIF